MILYIFAEYMLIYDIYHICQKDYQYTHQQIQLRFHNQLHFFVSK